MQAGGFLRATISDDRDQQQACSEEGGAGLAEIAQGWHRSDRSSQFVQCVVYANMPGHLSVLVQKRKAHSEEWAFQI